MRWPWWDRQSPKAPRPVVNPRRQELETAKEILAEVFGARPSDVEEMIRLTGWRMAASLHDFRLLGSGLEIFIIKSDISNRSILFRMLEL